MSKTEIEQILSSVFKKSFGIIDVDYRKLSEVSTYFQYPKNTILRDAFKKEMNLGYIIEGSTGNFVYKKDKRICVDLCYENSFFGDYSSLLTGKISPLEIQSLETITYISIPFTKLVEAYESPIVSEKIGRIAAEQLYILKNQQLIDLQTLSAEERYLKLLEIQPKVLQRTQSKYIASFLGITPESFSRIRKKILKSH
ncbi:Crp/Fnr family transcriptional regulator [Aquimarina algicola]|uniref:Crp/Fnr family transcriptional regulator n=1 Tax=Aquimarina algicola TaxID=2589995 RepID=A0A504JNJ1_9FLAO|nr:Crp/Fnr family transcriptional regulator [Aquimarina algicola]TPN89303.1 Crp/Fnr family transcriptional regulator [Aquimarina algicola]